MEEKVSVERLYSLGDYRNIKFSSEITGIPKELMASEFEKKLRYWQLVEIELMHRKYTALALKVQTLKLEETLEMLELERSTTIEELKEYLLNS
jgi:hypothetical protein